MPLVSMLCVETYKVRHSHAERGNEELLGAVRAKHLIRDMKQGLKGDHPPSGYPVFFHFLIQPGPVNAE